MQQNVPAWLIFGMFFVVLPIASLFIVERRDGTLARLVAQQVPFPLLLARQARRRSSSSTWSQAALMLLAGRYSCPWFGGEALALPARWDLLARGRRQHQPRGDRLGPAGRGVRAHARAGDGDRRRRQHPRRGGRRHHGAALRHAAGDAALADFSPMAWALDGFHAVLLREGGVAGIALPCAKLLALAAVLLALALLVQGRRRVLQPGQ